MTRYAYERQLDELAPPYDSEDWIIGGKNRAPDFYPRYGAAIRRHDPVAFNVGYSEARREEEYRRDQNKKRS